MVSTLEVESSYKPCVISISNRPLVINKKGLYLLFEMVQKILKK